MNGNSKPFFIFDVKALFVQLDEVLDCRRAYLAKLLHFRPGKNCIEILLLEREGDNLLALCQHLLYQRLHINLDGGRVFFVFCHNKKLTFK